MYTNKQLKNIVYHLPYKQFQLHWWAGYNDFRQMIIHSSVIETLVVNNYDLFDKSYVSLPRLREITIINFKEFDTNILDIYPKLNKIIFDNCQFYINKDSFINKDVEIR